MTKSEAVPVSKADEKAMPSELLEAQLVDADQSLIDEELDELASNLVIMPTSSDSPKSWKDLAAEDIASAAKPCVEVNLAASSIKYAGAIATSRVITVLKDEELVRGWLVSRLGNDLGYDLNRIKLENVYVAGRGRKNTAENSVRIDVIVEDDEQCPFYFIEAKAPDKFERDRTLINTQLFAVAALHEGKTGKRPKFLVYYTVEEVAGCLRDKALVIDYAKFPTHDSWAEAGMATVSDALSEKYNRPKKIPYVRSGARDLNSKFAPSEIKDLATSLHNVLWGGGSTGDTEVFTSLVNIILTKIQDEYDTEEGAEYKFQVFQHGEVVEKPEALYERLNELYREALTEQLGKEGDLKGQNIVNKEKFPLAKLVFAVGQIEKYSFVDGKNSLNGKDLLGDFFEQIQRDGFKQSKGQFFTPVNIVKFMLYAMELDTLSIEMINKEKKLPLIIDPSCGSATFLIETMKMVTSEVKHRQRGKLARTRQVVDTFEAMFMPDHKEHRWAREYLYGIEHNFDLATAAKVNMILHGDGSTNIFHKDGLKPFSAYELPAAAGSPNSLKVRTPSAIYGRKDVNAQFHVIISNPPFSVDLDDDTKKNLSQSFLFGDKKNSENLFIERYWQLLRDGGRMAIVLPESVFDTTENKYIRLFLFKYFHVRAVVSLPQLAFVPYTNTKTSILFAQKKTTLDVNRWTSLWDIQCAKYLSLSVRIRNYYKVHLEGASQNSFDSIKKKTVADAQNDLAALLSTPLTADELTMPIKDLLVAKTHFVQLALEVDKDSAEVFGRVNCNWVMRQVLAMSEADAADSGDSTMDQDSEMFLAEATSIGYKRSKRGEIPQPNDLFALEVAPSAIDSKVVTANYDKALKDIRQRIVAAKKRLTLAAGDKSVAQKIQAQITTLTSKDAELKAEQASTLASIARFYDAKGELLPIHSDRDDPCLLRIFDLPLMLHLRSNAILLDPKTPRTILDLMRAKRLWK